MKEGWEIKKLGDVCELINGLWTGKKEPFIDVAVYSMSNFTKDCRLDKSKPTRSITASLNQYEKRKLKFGDILLEKSGGGPNQAVGRVAFFDIDNNLNNTFSNFTARVRIKKNEQLIPEYLYTYLKYLYIIGITEKYQKNSTNIRNLQTKEYLTELIPIPPLPEQKQIVAILDKAFAAIDRAQANIEKNIENAKELFENWTFQTIKNANWNTINWGEVCDFTRGPFGGSLKKSLFVESGYAVYEQKQAIHNDYNALRYFIDEEKFQEMKRFEVKPTDLLMSCSGVTLGRVSEVPEDAPKGIINQALLKLTAKPDKVLNDFLVIWIRSKIFQDLIFKVAGGAAQPNVPGVKILKNIKLPCPTINEQEGFIELHDSMKEFTENSITANIRKKESLEELIKSILQKAFSGALTKQWIMENEKLIIKKEYAKST